MTRKALRKKQRQQARGLARPSARRPSSSWMAVGALMATTTLVGVPDAVASPRSDTVNGGAFGRPRAALSSVLRGDPRLALVQDALAGGLDRSVLQAVLQAAQAPAAGPARNETARRFDIPSGSIETVITAFEAATGLRVTVSAESIRMVTSPGVSGTFTPSQALEQILMGTSVTFRFTSATAVTLELRINAEAVNVTAPAPVAAVTSTKYVAPVRDTPQTIEVISQEIIEEQGARTLSDVLRNVPGISLQAGEGGGASSTSGDMFNMRGFSANNSLFVDGVRDDGLISRDVFNLEQVEVFLGPTGSDVGRGNAAGYVNMATKTPKLKPLYAATYAYGSADQKRLTVDLGRDVQIGRPGTWLGASAVRLNGMWQDGGVPGRQIVENKSQAIAPSVAFGLGMPTRVTLAAQFVRQNNIPDYGIPGGAWSDTTLAPTVTHALKPVDQSVFFGSVGYDYDKARQNSYTAKVEHDVNRTISITNQTRYNKTTREAVISTVQSPTSFVAATGLVTVARQGNERENEIASNQTTAIDRFSTGPLRHVATGSLELAHEEQFAPTLGGLGTRAPVSIYSPNPYDPVTGFAVVRTGAATTGKTNTVALSAFDTISAGQKWQLTGGLRWEHYNSTFLSVDATGATTTNLTVADGLFSGKVGALYRWTANGNVYVSYGTSVTPPGTANFTLSAQANNQNNPNVKPQTSTNLEVGSKWDFFHARLGFNAAVFQTRNKNVIFTVDATAVPPIYNQDDSQRVNGVTLGVNGRVTENWQVLANVAYLDATSDSQNVATNGNRLTLTPKYSGNLWTTYRTPFKLSLGGGIRYTDKVFVNAANTIQAPGYKIVDGLAEYPVNSHLSLRLNIYNLTDTVYIRNVNNNGGRYNPGNPRAATLTTSFTF